jgi:hypothetical protein
MTPYIPRKDGRFQQLHPRHWPYLFQILGCVGIVLIVAAAVWWPITPLPIDPAGPRLTALETLVEQQHVRLVQVETDTAHDRQVTIAFTASVEGLSKTLAELGQQHAVMAAQSAEIQRQVVINEARWREVEAALHDPRRQESPRVVIMQAEVPRPAVKQPVVKKPLPKCAPWWEYRVRTNCR